VRPLSYHRPCSAAAAVEAALLRRDGRLGNGRDDVDFRDCHAGGGGGGNDQEAVTPQPSASGGLGYDIWQRSSIGAQSEAGRQMQLIDKCRRLTHEQCAHTYDLELKMEASMERHASAQVVAAVLWGPCSAVATHQRP
jgi:hypothetical protein